MAFGMKKVNKMNNKMEIGVYINLEEKFIL